MTDSQYLIFISVKKENHLLHFYERTLKKRIKKGVVSLHSPNESWIRPLSSNVCYDFNAIEISR